jgi:hypothetical protein
VTRPHGTNTRGLQRRGSPAGPKVNPFGKARPKPEPPATRKVGWWTAYATSPDRAGFFQDQREQQRHMTGDTSRNMEKAQNRRKYALVDPD